MLCTRAVLALFILKPVRSRCLRSLVFVVVWFLSVILYHWQGIKNGIWPVVNLLLLSPTIFAWNSFCARPACSRPNSWKDPSSILNVPWNITGRLTDSISGDILSSRFCVVLCLSFSYVSLRWCNYSRFILHWVLLILAQKLCSICRCLCV